MSKRQCCMCYETRVYSLKDLKEELDIGFGTVERQAKLLLKLNYKEDDYFCEECFWK